MKRTLKTSLVAVASVLFLGALPKGAQARECSIATLEGSYGYHIGALVLPGGANYVGPVLGVGTPRTFLGRLTFDGRGNYTNALVINNSGTLVRVPNDVGT